jgi:ribosome-associated protein
LCVEISKEALLKEVSFKTSRSGGKGGQNVNKVSSKVELNMDINACSLFSEEQKQLLHEKLSKRINSEGILQVITEEERSQYLNKERSVEKLIVLISRALHQPKMRKATKPKKSAVEKRLKNKLQNALKKINRRGLEF